MPFVKLKLSGILTLLALCKTLNLGIIQEFRRYMIFGQRLISLRKFPIQFKPIHPKSFCQNNISSNGICSLYFFFIWLDKHETRNRYYIYAWSVLENLIKLEFICVSMIQNQIKNQLNKYIFVYGFFLFRLCSILWNLW